MISKKRCALIIGAAPEPDLSYLKPYLQGDEFTICADGGMRAAEKLGISPDWYVGDSDSGGHPDHGPTDTLPSEKDVTDLDMAVSRALMEGYREILLCGCSGGREDHHLSAIGQLERIYRSGGHGLLLGHGNEISLLTPGQHLIPATPHYHYFGIIPLDSMLQDISITGAKYVIAHRTLCRWESLGVSNELLPGEDCIVTVGEGVGLLIRSD